MNPSWVDDNLYTCMETNSKHEHTAVSELYES